MWNCINWFVIIVNIVHSNLLAFYDIKIDNKGVNFYQVYISKMVTELNANTMYEVMLQTDYANLKELCLTNKDAYKVFSSEEFWEKKYVQDYGKPEYQVNEWKQEYKMSYVKHHPKKIFKLNRRLDEYSNDTVLNIKARSEQDAYKFIAHYCNNDEHSSVISYLMEGYKNIKLPKPERLKALLDEYYKRQSSVRVYKDYLKEMTELYYLRPDHLYNAGAHNDEALTFFQYLYQNGYCADLVPEPYPDKISRPYFTAEDIETRLNLGGQDANSDGDSDDDEAKIDYIWLVEENYYEL